MVAGRAGRSSEFCFLAVPGCAASDCLERDSGTGALEGSPPERLGRTSAPGTAPALPPPHRGPPQLFPSSPLARHLPASECSKVHVFSGQPIRVCPKLLSPDHGCYCGSLWSSGTVEGQSLAGRMTMRYSGKILAVHLPVY